MAETRKSEKHSRSPQKRKMLDWLVYAVVGKILIYLWQTLPLERLGKLHSCDLCIGFWIYSILALALRVDLFEMNLITQIVTGAVTTFLVHVFSVGWKEKFSTIVI
jgi:hypothetical protein